VFYGIHEAAVKALPDGSADDRTPEYVPNTQAQMSV
jgi:hypothetical protein